MHTLTKQKVIDRVYDHYSTQQQPMGLQVTYTRDGMKRRCVYRHRNGKARCPIGLFISNNEYNRGYENANFVQICPARLKPLVPFLLEIQYIHDSIALWCTLPIDRRRAKLARKLCALAHKHGLTITVNDVNSPT